LDTTRLKTSSGDAKRRLDRRPHHSASVTAIASYGGAVAARTQIRSIPTLTIRNDR